MHRIPQVGQARVGDSDQGSWYRIVTCALCGSDSGGISGAPLAWAGLPGLLPFQSSLVSLSYKMRPAGWCVHPHPLGFLRTKSRLLERPCSPQASPLPDPRGQLPGVGAPAWWENKPAFGACRAGGGRPEVNRPSLPISDGLHFPGAPGIPSRPGEK